jgi:Uma2 family endonuclease
MAAFALSVQLNPQSAILRDTIPMATAALISLSEYLSNTYEPDCDYIDGELQERNVGERPHNAVQYILTERFNRNRREWNVIAFQEQRVHISAERYRVPDISVLRRTDPVDDIVQKAPLICIEVLSPEDRLHCMTERIEDYARMGVQHIWLIDPMTRHAWIATPDSSLQRIETEFTVPGTPIRLVLAEIFAELDDMQSQG